MSILSRLSRFNPFRGKTPVEIIEKYATLIPLEYDRNNDFCLKNKQADAFVQAIKTVYEDKSFIPNDAFCATCTNYISSQNDQVWELGKFIEILSRAIPQDETKQKEFFKNTLEIINTQERQKGFRDFFDRRQAEYESSNILAFMVLEQARKNTKRPYIESHTAARFLAKFIDSTSRENSLWALNQVMEDNSEGAETVFSPLFASNVSYLKSEECPKSIVEDYTNKLMKRINSIFEGTNGESNFINPNDHKASDIPSIGNALLDITSEHPELREKVVEGLLNVMNPLLLGQCMPIAFSSEEDSRYGSVVQDKWAEACIETLSGTRGTLPNGDFMIIGRIDPADSHPSILTLGKHSHRIVGCETNVRNSEEVGKYIDERRTYSGLERAGKALAFINAAIEMSKEPGLKPVLPAVKAAFTSTPVPDMKAGS